MSGPRLLFFIVKKVEFHFASMAIKRLIFSGLVKRVASRSVDELQGLKLELENFCFGLYVQRDFSPSFLPGSPVTIVPMLTSKGESTDV